MKGNKSILKSFAITALSIALCTSCKKTTNNITITSNDAANEALIASDELQVNNELDQAIDEAISGLCYSPTTSGGAGVNPTTVTGALIDTSLVTSGTVYIDYYGPEKDPSKGRSGNVQVNLPLSGGKPVPWTTKGVSANIIFPNTGYEIIYSKTNTSLWLKGTITVTNVSGGLQKNLVAGDSLIEQINGQESYTHNDNAGKIIIWTGNIHRTRIIKLANVSDITITTYGDTTVNGYLVADWGMSRFDQEYYTVITTPIYQDISASTFYNPLSGAKSIKNISEPITITYGVDAQGNPSATPFGYKLNWTNSSGAQQSVISY